MDVAAEAWEWIKYILLAALGLLGWFFKRAQARVDMQLENHTNSLAELRHNMSACATTQQLKELRAEMAEELNEVERDVKNLGSRFEEVVRKEIGELRREQHVERAALNKRLDLLILALSKRGDRQ